MNTRTKDIINIYAIRMENNNQYLKLLINTVEYCYGSFDYIDIQNLNNELFEYYRVFPTEILNYDKEREHYNILHSTLLKKLFLLYEGNICELNKDYLKLPEGYQCETQLSNTTQYGLNVVLSGVYFQLGY